MAVSYDANGNMQLSTGQISTHCGSSYSPSHSVQVFGSITKTILLSVIELVGHTGTQSPQDMHSASTIYKAMINPPQNNFKE
jgi:hypothetical protein